MFISKITLQNIRGFESQEFLLDRGAGTYAGWTVFTGDNGSGKSTLLKAIAVALSGSDAARALQPSFNGWIRSGKHEAAIELEIVRTAPDDETKNPTATLPIRIILKNGGRDVSIDSSNPARTLWAPEATGWFSCGYGPFRRVFGASPEATRQMVAPSTERFVTMFQEAASLSEVDVWLRALSHKALEHKASEKKQLSAILSILADDLMPNQISVDRVDSDGLWLKDRQGLSLSWSGMSDGYRSAVALLADILRHLIKTFGIKDLFEKDTEGHLRVARSGVVLIDEVDAHLHPEWQREIGFWLKRHFPRIQFLVTSHSPIICQAADPNGLFVLPEPGSSLAARPLTPDEYQRVIAARPDSILLSPAFGLQNTRSPRAVAARREFAEIAAKKRSGAKLTSVEKQKEKQVSRFIIDEEI